MRAALGAIAVALLFASGCAQKDWIDRTLVTVDVTGTWYGMAGGPASAHPGEFLLELKQEGATVTGFLRQLTVGGSSATGNLSGPINGSVAGDVFRFNSKRDLVQGELKVNGDAMSGTVLIAGTRPITLRRGDPSSSR